MEMIDEFNDDIKQISHFHCDDKTTTIVACGGWIHVYVDHGKTMRRKFSANLFDLAELFLRADKDLPSAEKLEQINLTTFEKLFVVADDVIFAIVERKLVLFKPTLRADLLSSRVGNMSSYVARKWDIKEISPTAESRVTRLAVIAPNESRTGPGANVHLDRQLYAGLFGLENRLRACDIALLCCANGHLWYLNLSCPTAPATFLHSIGDECAALCPRDGGRELRVCNRRGRVFTFSSDDDGGGYRVDESWLKIGSERWLVNSCGSGDLSDCSSSFAACGRFLVRRKQTPQNTAFEIDPLRLQLKDLNAKCKAMQTLLQAKMKDLKQLEQLSVLSTKTLKVTSAYEGRFLLVNFDRASQPCQSYHVITAAGRVVSSASGSIAVPFDDVIGCDVITPCACYGDVVIRCGELPVDVLKFAELKSGISFDAAFEFSRDLFYHDAFAARVVDVNAFFYGPAFLPKGNSFRLQVADANVQVTMSRVAGRVNRLQLRSDDERVLMALHAHHLRRVREYLSRHSEPSRVLEWRDNQPVIV